MPRPPVKAGTGRSRPVARPAAPDGSAGIDRLVAEPLRALALTPSPRADRRTLIRRVYFDLTGLPPTPEEVAAFVADESADAYRGWSTACSPRRTTASAGRGTGSTWSGSPRRNGFETNTPRPQRLALSRLRHRSAQRRQAVRPLRRRATRRRHAAARMRPPASSLVARRDEVKSPDPGLTANSARRTSCTTW